MGERVTERATSAKRGREREREEGERGRGEGKRGRERGGERYESNREEK